MAQTVYVGLSGGVDSALSAALLKEAKYNVVGAFIKIWSPEFTECTWKEDRLDAMRVAVSLGIPFSEIDLSKEYRESVVATMIAAYQDGVTPNPDVLCNREIKFGAFSSWAFSQGADCVATGHYAQILPGNIPKLARAEDSSKDQTYFLYRLTQTDLRKTIFPVGKFLKRDVRAMALKKRLPVSKRPDSQGLCFVGAITIPEFLSRFIPLKSGPVVSTDGTLLGEHDGAALYTLGQRHGFRVKNSPDTARHYVTQIDTKRNTITVSENLSDAMTQVTQLKDLSWIAEPPAPGRYKVQSRYREPFVDVSISSINPRSSVCEVIFERPHLVSPGQSVVIYSGDEVLGGGIASKIN